MSHCQGSDRVPATSARALVDAGSGMHACTPVSAWLRTWSRTASRRHSAAQTPANTSPHGASQGTCVVAWLGSTSVPHTPAVCGRGYCSFLWEFAHLLRSRELRAEGLAVHRASVAQCCWPPRSRPAGVFRVCPDALQVCIMHGQDNAFILCALLHGEFSVLVAFTTKTYENS